MMPVRDSKRNKAMVANGGQFFTQITSIIWISLLLFLVQSNFCFSRTAPESFADLVEKISPAVVNITTSTKLSKNTFPQGVVPEGSPFEDFFKDFQDRGDTPRGQRNTSALGAGFIISSDGFVVTNNHVIDGADEILIEFEDGEEMNASVIGVDKNIDIALLKIDTKKPLPALTFGDSDLARVGDWVMAIGNPLGQGFSVSAGIISARNRELTGNYDDYIQTDAAINRGNSGGPLFNMDGQVIGVNTAILSPNGGSIGIGFSMSSNVVFPVVEQLKKYGEVRRGWLGVSIGTVNEEIADSLEMDSPTGAIISNVFEPGPAFDAGLKIADVIIKFDKKVVKDANSLVRMVGKAAVGSAVEVVVIRNGKEKTFEVLLGKRKQDIEVFAQSEQLKKQELSQFLGMTISDIDDKIREKYGLSEAVTGVLISKVEQNTEAEKKGLRPDDIITDAGQKDISSVKELQEQIKLTMESGRDSILLLVRRAGQPRFVVLSLN